MFEVLKNVAAVGLEAVSNRYGISLRQPFQGDDKGSLTDDDDTSSPDTDSEDSIWPSEDRRFRSNQASWFTSILSPFGQDYRQNSYLVSQHTQDFSIIKVDPRICAFCIAVFRASGNKRLTYKGRKNYQTSTYGYLARSADNGCVLCNAFVSGLSSRFDSVTLKNSGCVTIYEDSHRVLKVAYGEVDKNLLGRPKTDPADMLTFVLEPETDGSVTTSPRRSNSRLEMAQKWLNTCDKSHLHCERSSYLPTRLIEMIGVIEMSNTSRIRLTKSSRLPKGTSYMTLSHCWGTSQPLKLLATNISAWYNEIPYSELPSNFKDALATAASLGCHYLWIDSLCIIQDSAQDWAAESAQMGKVYSNSFLNISATAASDGLFDRDDSKILDKIRLDLSSIDKSNDPSDNYWAGQSSKVHDAFFFYNTDTFQDSVNKAPLNRRAWVLQERLLSKRNLHFSVNGMFWECCELTAGESFPDRLPVKMKGSHVKKDFARTMAASFSPSSLSTIQNQQEVTHTRLKAKSDQLHAFWASMVITYCTSRLTFSTDRLLAFAGLATQFEQAISASNAFSMLSKTNQQYLAGIWNHEIPSQLLWKIVGLHPSPQEVLIEAQKRKRNKENEKRSALLRGLDDFDEQDSESGDIKFDLKESDAEPRAATESDEATYVAPSWSWASTEGLIEEIWKPPYDGLQGVSRDLISITSSWTKLADGDNPYGQVHDGCLNLLGKLAIAKFTGVSKTSIGASIKLEGSWLNDVDRQRQGSGTFFWEQDISISWDCEQRLPKSLVLGEVIWFLPIRCKAKEKEVLERVLERSHSGVNNLAETPCDDLFEIGAVSDFHGAFMEGLVLRGTSEKGNESDTDREKGTMTIPEKLRRIGKWETLAVGRFLDRIAYVDRELAANSTTRPHGRSTSKADGRYEITIV